MPASFKRSYKNILNFFNPKSQIKLMNMNIKITQFIKKKKKTHINDNTEAGKITPYALCRSIAYIPTYSIDSMP